ncbi:hypothetical protein Hte_009612 [Hypoxylon texense]
MSRRSLGQVWRSVVEECHTLYPEFVQIVEENRELEWCEKLRQHSWVLKSMGGGSSETHQIRFLGPALGDPPAKDKGSVEKFGPA